LRTLSLETPGVADNADLQTFGMRFAVRLTGEPLIPFAAIAPPAERESIFVADLGRVVRVDRQHCLVSRQ
jgi:hypothetical protein